MNVSLEGLTVAIGMPVDNPIPHKTAMSLAETAFNCGHMGLRLDILFRVSGIVTVARNGVLESFLSGPCQKLFWIDSDMTWSKESFFRLLALSTKRDIVGGGYRFKKDEEVFSVLTRPGVSSEEFGLIPVEGMGLGFCVMDRAPLEKLAATKPRVRNDLDGTEMNAVFRTDIVDGHLRTEDMAFFADLREMGHTIWLDPSIELGHIGEKEYRGRFSNHLERKDSEH